LKRRLELIYGACNRREYVHPDPLELLYAYHDPRDLELVGLLAACLAYGRVAQILTSIRAVLDRLSAGPGASPAAALARIQPREIVQRMEGFKHRFTTGGEVASLLIGMIRLVDAHGSLERAFSDGLKPADDTTLPALTEFVERLRKLAGKADACASLLSSPRDGSACKRLNLFLRWMVRRDAVDPGPWTGIAAALLVVPLDTHLFRIAGNMGLTRRRQPDLKTAMEVTRGFARICPDDPVRYDFALTRLGINPACRGLTDTAWIYAPSRRAR
jgi:uncharacterized protein (TIGR02757 family)